MGAVHDVRDLDGVEGGRSSGCRPMLRPDGHVLIPHIE